MYHQASNWKKDRLPHISNGGGKNFRVTIKGVIENLSTEHVKVEEELDFTFPKMFQKQGKHIQPQIFDNSSCKGWEL